MVEARPINQYRNHLPYAISIRASTRARGYCNFIPCVREAKRSVNILLCVSLKMISMPAFVPLHAGLDWTATPSLNEPFAYGPGIVAVEDREELEAAFNAIRVHFGFQGEIK